MVSHRERRLGGGTFEVIAALKDRIDIVVRAVPFSGREIGRLADRVASSEEPTQQVPRELVFTPEQLDEVGRLIRETPVAPAALEVLGVLTAQLDFCRQASRQLEFMSKDTLHLAGKQVAHVCTEDCPLDKHENICGQVETGISARAHLATLLFAKALAYFRGAPQATLEDLRVVLPWTLHHKLRPNNHSAHFQKEEHRVHLVDRVAWIQQLVDRCILQYASSERARARANELLSSPVPSLPPSRHSPENCRSSRAWSPNSAPSTS